MPMIRQRQLRANLVQAAVTQSNEAVNSVQLTKELGVNTRGL